MKIYTKLGDEGYTSVIGGKRLPKYDLRIETYGSVDELIAHVGLLRSYELEEKIINSLITIQHVLMNSCSIIAYDKDGEVQVDLPEINEENVELLEKEIDMMEQELPVLRNFLLPGGDVAVSQANVCRTVCRRAERLLVKLAAQAEVPKVLIRFFNRLSDFFFVLLRYIALKKDIEQIIWKFK